MWENLLILCLFNSIQKDLNLGLKKMKKIKMYDWQLSLVLIWNFPRPFFVHDMYPTQETPLVYLDRLLPVHWQHFQ